MSSAPDEMRRALGVVPLTTSGERGWAMLEAHLWHHGAFRGHVGAMPEHVIMGYFDTPRLIEQRIGRARRRSVTDNANVTIIPAGHSADWDISGTLDVVHLYVPEERLVRVASSLDLQAPELLDAVAQPSSTLAGLVRLLAGELKQGAQTNSLYADTLSEFICMHLIRTHAAEAGSARVERAFTTGFGLAPAQVTRVKDYLLAHIGRQVGLKELSDLVGLSPKHLCTAFRRATGLPPHAWVRHRRMEQAKALLLQPGSEIAQIALRLGYSEQSVFTTAFRKAAGMSPGHWRRQRG